MEKIIKILNQNNGYARMKELRKAGIQTRDIAKAVDNNIIEKIKHGLYKLIDFPWDEHAGFTDVCNANKNAVITLLSAADYHQLSTFYPSEIYVAVPNNTDKFILKYPPIKVYYFIEKYYKLGIQKIETASGIVKIYNKEKTICDLFRYSNKLGEDIAIESLKEYLKNKANRNISQLIEYAEMCKVTREIETITKAILS